MTNPKPKSSEAVPRFPWGETLPAVVQSVAYQYDTAEELEAVFDGSLPGYNYTRVGNPTTTALEARLTALDQGRGAVAVASGMAASTAVAIALLQQGDHIVAARGMFAGTVSLFEDTLSRFGITITFVEAGDTEAVLTALQDNTRMVFVEIMGNPKLDVPDLPAIAKVTRPRRIPLVVDSTLMTPAVVRPKELDVDVVVYSTSKYIHGHGTAIGGAVVDTGNYDWAVGPFVEIQELAQDYGDEAFLAYLRNVVTRNLGGCPAPWNSFLTVQGLQTLTLRMQQHCENARQLAIWLEQHSAVTCVNYAGLPASPYYQRVKDYFGGNGGALLTFCLGSRAKAWRFLDHVRLAKQAANLGDVHTLVIHPSSTIFHSYDLATQQEMGVTEDMIRVSVGLEAWPELRDDFDQALQQVGK
ncbi:O-acetylhomoserine aminocarboxypropyltransferase/cysteine synthase family protein [Planctomycetota bacterium]